MQTESGGIEKIFHDNGGKEHITILIPDKTDFKIKTGRRDQEKYYIMLKIN